MRWPTPAVASGRRVWGGTPLEATGSLREEVDDMLMVQVFSRFFDFLLEIFSRNICTNI